MGIGGVGGKVEEMRTGKGESVGDGGGRKNIMY